LAPFAGSPPMRRNPASGFLRIGLQEPFAGFEEDRLGVAIFNLISSSLI
jgi:hypothetical protein